MDRLIYTAMSSLKLLDSMKVKQANALANVNTIGFKDTFNFATETAAVEGPGFNSRFVPVSQTIDEVVLTEGPLRETGRQMDVYMKQSTVLGVEAPNGQVAFTRRGDLNIDEAGFLKTGNGFLVLGEGGGPIATPVGLDLFITDDGSVMAADPALPETPPSSVGKLMLRDSSETILARRADSLYEPKDKLGQGGDFQTGPIPPSVSPGALEGSAVSVAEQLVNFMDMSRSFEIRVKMISEMKELDDSGTSMMRYA